MRERESLLTHLRKILNLTQAEAGDKLGIEQSRISELESTATPVTFEDVEKMVEGSEYSAELHLRVKGSRSTIRIR